MLPDKALHALRRRMNGASPVRSAGRMRQIFMVTKPDPAEGRLAATTAARFLQECQSRTEESAAKLRKHLAQAEELSGLLAEHADKAIGKPA